LSYYVWYWVFQRTPHKQYLLPYSAQSPISKKKKKFITEDDIWNEILSIKENNKFSLGQQLFYLIPLFANDSYVINNEFIRLLNEYHYHKDFNIPLSDTLDNADAIKLSMFSIIKNEMELAIRHKTEKNGNSKS
jgi:hypothetical protein